MKKVLIALGVIAFFVFIFFMWANNNFDKAVKLQENVNASWGDVVSQYQRRADLVPMLVETVKGAAENERGILTAVTQARAGIVNAKTPEDLEIMGRKINTAINLAFEAYPQIKSTQNFSDLQAQLEGTENRISVGRMNYNKSVKEYNGHIRGFFRKFAIGILAEDDEFPKKEMFQAVSDNVEQAPKVSFKN